jgi:hypothetical protein
MKLEYCFKCQVLDVYGIINIEIFISRTPHNWKKKNFFKLGRVHYLELYYNLTSAYFCCTTKLNLIAKISGYNKAAFTQYYLGFFEVLFE